MERIFNERISEALSGELTEENLRVLIENFPEYSIPSTLLTKKTRNGEAKWFYMESTDHCVDLNPQAFFIPKRKLEPTSLELRKYIFIFIKVFTKRIVPAFQFQATAGNAVTTGRSFEVEAKDEDITIKGWNALMVMDFPQNVKSFDFGFEAHVNENDLEETIFRVFCQSDEPSAN
jgi:hypothetical protein